MLVRPRAALGDQYRFMFDWLRERLGRRVWVERSGGSLIFGLALMRLFPEARVVHVYRDGRDTALSLRQHPAFKSGPAVARNMQRRGVNLYGGDPLSGLSVFTLLMLRFVNVKKMAGGGDARPGSLRRLVEPTDSVEPDVSVGLASRTVFRAALRRHVAAPARENTGIDRLHRPEPGRRRLAGCGRTYSPAESVQISLTRCRDATAAHPSLRPRAGSVGVRNVGRCEPPP